jgi:hypothetical protein
MNGTQENVLGVLKIVVVNARFGLGRVLKKSLTFIQKFGFIHLGNPLGIFIIEKTIKKRSKLIITTFSTIYVCFQSS